jgi:hypothetical protein
VDRQLQTAYPVSEHVSVRRFSATRPWVSIWDPITLGAGLIACSTRSVTDRTWRFADATAAIISSLGRYFPTPPPAYVIDPQTGQATTLNLGAASYSLGLVSLRLR